MVLMYAYSYSEASSNNFKRASRYSWYAIYEFLKHYFRPAIAPVFPKSKSLKVNGRKPMHLQKIRIWEFKGMVCVRGCKNLILMK